MLGHNIWEAYLSFISLWDLSHVSEILVICTRSLFFSKWFTNSGILFKCWILEVSEDLAHGLNWAVTHNLAGAIQAEMPLSIRIISEQH